MHKPLVERHDYVSEADGKQHYLARITLPTKIEEGHRWIEFKELLSFDCYYIDETEDGHRVAYIAFDFGMQNEIQLKLEHNFILKGKENATDEEKMIIDVTFDLFHAFFHTSVDPNYSHYHWALYGMLNNRVTTGEDV